MIRKLFRYLQQRFKRKYPNMFAPLVVNFGVWPLDRVLYISIKGDVYGYKAKPDTLMSVYSISWEFDRIEREQNGGHALAWLKQNTILVHKPSKKLEMHK